MQRLPEALHARCRENVRLGSRVLGLMRRSGGWVLEMEKGTLDAETVVLTCDSGAAALLLERIDPE